MSSPASSPAAPGSARDLRRRQFGLAVALLALPAAFVLFQMFFGQSVAFLYGDRDRAEWITYPHAPSAKVVVVDPTRPVPLRFEKSFTLARMPEHAVMLHVRVLDRVELVEGSVLCPFGLLSRTAGQLAVTDVGFLEDDVGAFVPANPAVVVRAEMLAEWPDIEAVFAGVSELLDDAALRALANDLERDGASPRSVARAWLLGEGLAGP